MNSRVDSKKPSQLDKFIAEFEKKKNILEEDFTHRFEGWHSMSFWKGKIDEETYDIYISRLDINPNRWDVHETNNYVRGLTDAIMKIAKKNKLINPIMSKKKIEMLNPDRCVFTAILKCDSKPSANKSNSN